MSQKKPIVVSGMRPTGLLHLGHYFGVLKNWVALQKNAQCYFFVADWHSLTTEYAHVEGIRKAIPEIVTDWLAAGVDPEACVVFVQSQVPEHAELHLLLSMITPLGWLERVPSFKELQQELKDKDLSTYGFLGYPLLQTADVAIYKGTQVPVGQDQVAHLELSREIVRRFNHLYGEVLAEPEARLTKAPKILGTDGRKMSKSYNNSINLSDSEEEMNKKLARSMTDPARQRRQDPGNPKICPIFGYHEILSSPQTQAEVIQGCTTAQIGCLDCKKIVMKNLAEELAPFREKRKELMAKPEIVNKVLDEGRKKAAQVASVTLNQVRQAMGVSN